MNIFDKIVDAEHANDARLGMPATDSGHFDRRMNLMAAIRGGKGFRHPPKATAVRATGKTRGEMKRELRAAANAKVSEDRAPEFMHSAARRMPAA
jgi:hypothetical protein